MCVITVWVVAQTKINVFWNFFFTPGPLWEPFTWKSLKNVNFSLWGKPCIVLPEWIFFPRFGPLWYVVVLVYKMKTFFHLQGSFDDTVFPRGNFFLSDLCISLWVKVKLNPKPAGFRLVNNVKSTFFSFLCCDLNVAYITQSQNCLYTILG